jgi:hypothetical protein
MNKGEKNKRQEAVANRWQRHEELPTPQLLHPPRLQGWCEGVQFQVKYILDLLYRIVNKRVRLRMQIVATKLT